MASADAGRSRTGTPAGVSRRARGAGLPAVAIALAALFAAPLVYLLVRNLADAGAAWRALVERGAGPLARSLLLGAAVSATAAVLGTTAAWISGRTDVPGARVWRTLLPLPLVIPSFIGAFALIAALAPGGLLEQLLTPLGVGRLPRIDGFWGSYLVLSLLTYPYVYLPVVARLRGLPPSLEEAARLFGRSPREVFRTVVLPQTRGAIVAGSLLVFLYVISDFGVVQLLRYDALTRTIYATRLFERDVSLALSLELAVLALALVALERIASRSRAARVGSSTVSMRVPLRRWKAAAVAFLATLIGVALLLPVAVLAFWAVRGLAHGSARAGALVADIGQLAGPAANTAIASVLAGALAVAAVTPLAFAAARRRSRVVGASSSVVVAGFALPGLAIALALVFWAVRAPGILGALYQSYPLLLFAYVVHFGALALQASTVAIEAIPGTATEAARALGAGRFRRFRTIDAPLMAPGVLAGAALVTLSTMKELPATLLLAPPGFETLATRIWTATEDAFFADASLASLVLITLSAVMTWTLVLRHDGTRAEGLRARTPDAQAPQDPTPVEARAPA